MPLNAKDVLLDSQTSDPGTPEDGCIWYNSTSGKLKGRENGVTVELGAVGGSGDVVGPASAVADNLASYNATTGKLIKDSGIAAASVAAMLAVGGTAPQELSSTSLFTTTSTSYVLVTGMTATPVAGTYIAIFTCEMTASNSNKNMFFGIFSDGTIVGHSERIQQNKTSEGYNSVGTSALVTVNGSQAVELKAKAEVGADTKIKNRSFTLIRQS